MAMKKWIVGSPDREIAKKMAEECDIDPFAALIACGRGITDSSELELMLSSEPLLCDPNELIDISSAAEYVNTAIENGITIAVYGDYDCDGVVSTTIMYEYLVSRGAKAVYYIPDRINEGYGMNCAAVDKLKSQGVGLIVTVDNGISCAEEISYAASLGIKTVVTDHHIPPDTLPEAEFVVDPHRSDCPSGFKEICGAQVAFKLVCVMDDKEPEQLLPQYADLLSIAILGDVMPLVNENHSIVRAGVSIIRNKPRTGISAIINVAGIDRASISSEKIAFGIAPRINASGRMGDAARALRLLLTTDIKSAITIANEIDDDNTKRQQIERKITAEAIQTIEENGYQYNRVIVVSKDDWHSGVLGIVASKLTEKYGKPSIVLTEIDSVCHGSARSYPGFHIYNAIASCKDILVKYGGHELAAGISIQIDMLDRFRTEINRYAAGKEFVPAHINIDFRINPTGMSVDMAFAIKSLEPFGAGNPVPVFGLFGVKLEKITPIGNGKHLKLLFAKSGSAFQALLFGVTPDKFCFEIGDELDLAVTLDANFFREEYNLSVIIKALRISGTDEDKIFNDIKAFDDYASGASCAKELLLPSRAEVGTVYKYIAAKSVLKERIKYAFLNDIGYAKTMVAVKTLCELGLVDSDGGKLSSVSGAKKTDLMTSQTYKELSEMG